MRIAGVSGALIEISILLFVVGLEGGGGDEVLDVLYLRIREPSCLVSLIDFSARCEDR